MYQKMSDRFQPISISSCNNDTATSFDIVIPVFPNKAAYTAFFELPFPPTNYFIVLSIVFNMGYQ
jgi:hypothetical protein